MYYDGELCEGCAPTLDSVQQMLLVEKCFELLQRILGCHHPDTVTLLEDPNSLQIENFERGI